MVVHFNFTSFISENQSLQSQEMALNEAKVIVLS